MSAAQTTLSRRALNRALLARQMLLERRRMPVRAAIEHLVGMQAQAPDLPYVGLWSRLEGFTTDELSRLVEQREAVRMTLQRATIHLVTTRDALSLRPLLQRVPERALFAGSPWWKQAKGVDVDALVVAGREIMGERPRTVAELAKLLRPRFPDHDALALAYVVRALVPMVFTTPRGTWGGKGLVKLTTVEAWLGRPLGAALPTEKFALRYLAAFGPASAADARAWSGLSVRDAFERLRPRLRTFRDGRGIELFDLPKAPRPDPQTQAPVRFLPDYDNILLGHADRTRIMARGQHIGLFSPQGIMKGTVLVDGFLRAGWRPIGDQTGTALSITPLEKPIPPRQRIEITEEGLRLLQFLAPGEKHAVRFGPIAEQLAGTRT